MGVLSSFSFDFRRVGLVTARWRLGEIRNVSKDGLSLAAVARHCTWSRESLQDPGAAQTTQLSSLTALPLLSTCALKLKKGTEQEISSSQGAKNRASEGGQGEITPAYHSTKG